MGEAGRSAGAGLLAGAVALAVLTALPWSDRAGTGWEVWAGFGVAAGACLLLFHTCGPRGRAGQGRAGVRRWAGALALLASAVAAVTFPADSLEAFAPAEGLVVPSRAAVRLWVCVAATALGALFLALAGAPAGPRPPRRSPAGPLAGALPVLVAGALVGPALFPAERHTVAAGAPPAGDAVAWEWEPPGRVAVREVLSGPYGPLVLLGDGAVALDGASGGTVWTYRRPHPGTGGGGVGSWGDAMEVWSGGGRVHLAERSEEPAAVLDAVTGARLAGRFPGREAVRAAAEERLEEGRRIWRRAVEEPPGCHRGPGREVAGVLVGLVGCADGFDDLGVLVVDGVRARFSLVGVDPDRGRELWRREWEGSRPSFTPVTAVQGDPLVVLGAGDGEPPVGLDPATGEEVLPFPGEEPSRPPDALLQADTAGLVAVFETGDGGLLVRRSAPDGGIVSRWRPEGAAFDGAVLAAAAVTPDAVFLPVYEGGGREPGAPVRVLRLADGGAVDDLGVHPAVDVLAGPGWAVAVLGDGYGPTGLRSLAG